MTEKPDWKTICQFRAWLDKSNIYVSESDWERFVSGTLHHLSPIHKTFSEFLQAQAKEREARQNPLDPPKKEDGLKNRKQPTRFLKKTIAEKAKFKETKRAYFKSIAEQEAQRITRQRHCSEPEMTKMQIAHVIFMVTLWLASMGIFMIPIYALFTKEEYFWCVFSIWMLHGISFNLVRLCINDSDDTDNSDAAIQCAAHIIALISVGIIAIIMVAVILAIIGFVWYYFCCGFLLFPDEIWGEGPSFGEAIVYAILSLVCLVWIGGLIAIAFGWNPPK